MKAYNQITPASREQIDTVKSNLIDALRERDPHGLCTLDVAGLAAQDNGYGPAALWPAFYELFSEGMCMFALTSSGLRFSRCGEMHEAEIKRHFGHAYIFRDKTFWITARLNFGTMAALPRRRPSGVSPSSDGQTF